MPNPLTLMTASVQPNANPDKSQPEQRGTNGGLIFQDIVDENANQDDVDDDAAVFSERETDGDIVGNEIHTDADLEPELVVHTITSPSTKAELATELPDKDKASQPDFHEIEVQQSRNPIPTENILPDQQSAKPIDPARIQTNSVLTVSSVSSDRHSQASQPNLSSSDQTRLITEQAVITRAIRAIDPNSSINENKIDLTPEHWGKRASLSDTPQRVQIHNSTPQMLSAPAHIQLLAKTNEYQTDEPFMLQEVGEIPSSNEVVQTQNPRDIGTIANSAPPTARAEIARAIAGQMATMVTARPGAGSIEIALSPEELGRVSIVLNGREDGMQLVIAAERPETLDLMRRHISLLSAEFQKLGYANLSFDLDTPSDAYHDSQSDNSEATPDVAEPDREIQHTATIQKTIPDRGLDMRL